MGSVDKKNLTGKFYNFISHKIFNSYKINIMIGKNFRNKKSFFNKIKIKNNIKFVKPNIKSFQNFYKNFDTVFSGVNTTMYEQLQYGFKPFCISQNKIQTDNGKRLNNKKYINLINLNKINQINLKKKIEKNVNFFSKPQSSLSKKLKKNTLYKVCNIIKKNI